MKVRNFMEENKEYTPVHSYDEVMKAIMKLPEEEKNAILKYVDIVKIASALDSEEICKSNIIACQECVYAYTMVSKALDDLYKLVNAPENATDEMLSDYDRLNVSQKKETALKLLNNSEFQKDCCEILISDMERNIASDSTLKALDNLLGITKYLRRCLRLGIGADHQYRIE